LDGIATGTTGRDGMGEGGTTIAGRGRKRRKAEREKGAG